MRTWNYLAAVLLIGGSTIVGCNKDETATTTQPSQPAGQTPGDKVGNAVKNGVDSTTKNVDAAANKVGAVLSPTGADSLMGAKKAVQGVVDNATDKNNFKAVASYFTKADEDRIDKTKPDTKDLDDQIDAFQKSWNGKYGHNFKIKDLNTDFADAFLSVAQDSADPNRAVGTIAGTGGSAEIKVPFVREGPQWRIDVPDDVDGAVLHSNLVATLTTLNQGSSSWPDNEVLATQAVTHGIMATILNKK